MKFLLLFTLLFSTLLFSDNDEKKYEEHYTLSFTKEHNCTLVKNGIKIDLFDKKFKKKDPKSAYTCHAIQKEQYNDCKIVNKKNISAMFFAYGSYEYTNFIIAFQNPHQSVDSSLEVDCTKKLSNK